MAPSLIPKKARDRVKTDRLQRLEQALQEQGKAWRFHPVVEALQTLRGVQGTVAVTTVAELGDLTRFDTPENSRNSWA